MYDCPHSFIKFSTFFYLFFFSHSIGERPLPSTSPATKQKFSRQQSRRGGGLVLECEYDLEVVDGAVSSGVIDEIKAVVEHLEGMETVVEH